MQNKESKRFCFTQNNYSLDSMALLELVECKYMIYGKEVAPETLTPHLQGYVVFGSNKRLKAVIALLPGCHISIAKGNGPQNITYCSKEGVVTERGERPVSQGEGTKKKWDVIYQAAKDGDVDLIPDEIRFKFPKLIESHRVFDTQDTEEKMDWYYGGSGTGKSRRAREENPGCYLKMCNKWWDGYAGQAVVLIEDFDKNHAVLIHHMKIWADRYKFPAEIKGAKIDIRPRRIIVTSNYHPRDIWVDDKDLGPILRRYKITHFSGYPNPPNVAGQGAQARDAQGPPSQREGCSETRGLAEADHGRVFPALIPPQPCDILFMN